METETNNDEIKTNKFLTRVFIAMCIFVVAFISLYALFMMFIAKDAKWEERGQFGDMFGFVNAIFSGLAFAGLIYTAFMQRVELSMQREELILQRKEMELNRGELKKQSDAQLATEKTLREQAKQQREVQAEGTFFNLLNSIRSLVSNTEGEITPTKERVFDNVHKSKYGGLNYFSQASKELQKRITSSLSNDIIYAMTSNFGVNTDEINRKVKETYNVFFQLHSPELAHYFRFTFNVLTFVDSNPDIPEEKKIKYINFVQSQMSDSELQLLFYNGMGEFGKKYYVLIEKYDFLQNMNTSQNKGVVELLKDAYPNSSFRL